MHGLKIGLLLLLGLGLIFWGLQGGEAERLTLMLDWLPNPDHVPLYVAQEEGLFAEEGLEVEILVPGNPSDPAKLVAAGRVALGITTGLNLIIARDQGLPLTAIGALI
ncbi:MAG: ABC transporter substrate-binding protein, partial [Candidatus Bipolaricaulia bacterium]